jgi:hypothetical protein
MRRQKKCGILLSLVIGYQFSAFRSAGTDGSQVIFEWSLDVGPVQHQPDKTKWNNPFYIYSGLRRKHISKLNQITTTKIVI